MLSRFSHVWLCVTPWTVARQAPLSMEILQAGVLEWVAFPFSRGSSQPRNPTGVSCIAGGFFTSWATRGPTVLCWFLPYNVHQPLSIHMCPPSGSSLPPLPAPPVGTECWVGLPVLRSSSPLSVSHMVVLVSGLLSQFLPPFPCPVVSTSLHLYSCPAKRFIEIFRLKDGYLRSRKWFKNYKFTGLLWWLSGKESTYQCRRHRFDPSSGKILHAVEQLSPCATAIESVLWSLGATTAEPRNFRKVFLFLFFSTYFEKVNYSRGWSFAWSFLDVFLVP